jgi:hypothetical protein
VQLDQFRQQLSPGLPGPIRLDGKPPMWLLPEPVWQAFVTTLPAAQRAKLHPDGATAAHCPC